MNSTSPKAIASATVPARASGPSLATRSFSSSGWRDENSTGWPALTQSAADGAADMARADDADAQLAGAGRLRDALDGVEGDRSETAANGGQQSAPAEVGGCTHPDLLSCQWNVSIPLVHAPPRRCTQPVRDNLFHPSAGRVAAGMPAQGRRCTTPVVPASMRAHACSGRH